MSQMTAPMRLRTGTSMTCTDVTLRASQVEFVGETLGCHGLAGREHCRHDPGTDVSEIVAK